MSIEDAEAEVLKWLATTPGAKDAVNNDARRNYAVLLFRHAEIEGFSRGYAMGREVARDLADKLNKIAEVLGE